MFEVDVYLYQTNKRIGVWFSAYTVTYSGIQWGPWTQFDDDGTFQYSDGTVKNFVPAFNYSANTWYKLRYEVDMGTDTYDMYVDDSLIGSGLGANTASTPAIEQFIVNPYYYSPPGGGQSIIVLDPRMRELTDNPPSVSGWDTERSMGLDGQVRSAFNNPARLKIIR